MKRYFQQNSLTSAILSLIIVYSLQSAFAQNQPLFSTHYDNIPNFAQNPTIRSAQNGFWSDPNTWTPARLPTEGDVMLISHVVTYGNTSGEVKTIGINVGGILKFKNDQDTKLKVGTLLVTRQGRLEVGTQQNPIQLQKTAEIIIADQTLDLSNDNVGVFDPGQYGTGILAIDGAVTMHGAPHTSTFVRLTKEPRAGDITLTIEQSISGWKSGDRLILPDTRALNNNETEDNYVPQWEELFVQSVSGETLTLTSPLQFDHSGARTMEGNLEFLPHVANLSRNVIVRSENPAGTRGHIFFTYHADTDVRYVQFKELGRYTNDPADMTMYDSNGNVTHIGTNQPGRVPYHAHHLYGPQVSALTYPVQLPDGSTRHTHQFIALGNSFDGGSQQHNYHATWLHDSHYGLFKDNIIYNSAGSGFGIKDGSESFNVIERNFVMRVHGNGVRDQVAGGNAFWFRGVNNFVRDNVATNVQSKSGLFRYGYHIRVGQGGTVKIPNFQGGDTSVTGEYTVVDPHTLPILEFARNEVYGATGHGFDYWYIGALGTGLPRATKLSIIKDLKIWHVTGRAIFHYPSSKVVIDGLVVRGRYPTGGGLIGFDGGDYMAHDWTMRNADIQGMQVGIAVSTQAEGDTPQIMEDSYLRNKTNIYISTMFTSSADGERLNPRKTIIRNVKFASIEPSTYVAIEMAYSDKPIRHMINKDELIVEHYNQIPNNNFQVFYKEQHADFIVPQTFIQNPSSGFISLIGSPEAGLTNQENWAKYGIAIGGAITPCVDDTSHPEINGFTCPITLPHDETPPAAPVGLITIE